MPVLVLVEHPVRIVDVCLRKHKLVAGSLGNAKQMFSLHGEAHSNLVACDDLVVLQVISCVWRIWGRVLKGVLVISDQGHDTINVL